MLSFSGETSAAPAVLCQSAVNGDKVKITTTDCTVSNAPFIPTTVSFENGAAGSLILNGAAPTGAVTTKSAGIGAVIVSATTATANTYGASAGSKSLASMIVNDGVTFGVGHDLFINAVTVGQGASGVLNQTAGTMTSTTLAVAAGATFTQSGTGILTATNTTLAQNSTLTLVNQGTGAIDGLGGDKGALVFAGNYNTDTAIGATNSLASISVNDGVTLTLDQNASALAVTVGQGVSGILNQTAGTLATTTLAISAGGTLTQSGTGVINTTNTTIATGGSLTVLNQGTGGFNGTGTGLGALTFAGNYNTDQKIGDVNALASITVNNGVTLTLDMDAAATTVNVGQGLSGIVNQSAGTLTATTLNIGAGGTFTQSAGGVINATNTTIGSTGALTLVNQGTGAIDGTGAGLGALTIAGNYNTDAAIGGTNSLASITINDATTLTLDQNASATAVNVGQGVSGIVNQSAGTLTATTLTIGAGGTVTQSGTGVINATNVTIGSTGALTLVNQGTGAIDGTGAGLGALTIAGNYNTDAAIGGTNSLASITINNGKTLTLDQNASATAVNVGQGVSGIVNQSAGTLTATTLAIKAGGTVTQSGTGVINTTSTTIATGGALTLQNQGTGTIDGTGAGLGALTIADNYNTDAAIGGTNTLASVTLNNGVNLSLDQNLSATTVNVGQGTSGAVNQSAGTLAATTLAIKAGGTVTQSGTGVINTTSTTIATGGALTLQNQGTGTIDGTGLDLGALTFAGNYNTDAVIGGTNSLASLTVNDGATLTLDQNASAATFNVGQGTSGVVNHSTGVLTATSLILKSGAIFNQTGAGGITATTTVQDGATFNLSSAFTHTGGLTIGGGTSGVLDVAGNTLTASSTFEMKAGATLKTTINTDTANDAGRVIATGVVTINAATTIDITVTPGALTTGQTFVIVQGGAGGAVSAPTTIVDNSTTYNFTAATDGNSLTLTTVLASNGAGQYTPSAKSSNTTSVAKTLDNIVTAGASGDMATVTTALNGLSGTALDTALAKTTPDPVTAVGVTSVAAQSQFLNVIGGRLSAARTGSANVSGVSSGNEMKNAAVWLQGFGNTIKQGRRKDEDGYDAQTFGLAAGADRQLEGSDWILGASYAYALSDVNFAGSRLGNGSDIKSHQVSLYGTYDGGNYFVDVIGSGAYNTFKSNRAISIGALERTANAGFIGKQFSAKATGGFDIDYGAWRITPLASIQATGLNIGSYTETGAGALNLSVASQSYTTVQSGLGFRSSYPTPTVFGEFVPSVHGLWLYNVNNPIQTSTATFTGGGASFKTEGVAPARHAGNVGVSLNYDMSDSASLAATYDAEIKDQFTGHSGTATMRLKF